VVGLKVSPSTLLAIAGREYGIIARNAVAAAFVGVVEVR